MIQPSGANPAAAVTARPERVRTSPHPGCQGGDMPLAGHQKPAATAGTRRRVPSPCPGGAPIRSEDPNLLPRRNSAAVAKASLLSNGRNPSAVNKHIKRSGRERLLAAGAVAAESALRLGNAEWCCSRFRSLFLAVFPFAVDCPGPWQRAQPPCGASSAPEQRS